MHYVVSPMKFIVIKYLTVNSQYNGKIKDAEPQRNRLKHR